VREDSKALEVKLAARESEFRKYVAAQFPDRMEQTGRARKVSVSQRVSQARFMDSAAFRREVYFFLVSQMRLEARQDDDNRICNATATLTQHSSGDVIVRLEADMI
jgi:hypothetical protein